MVFQTAPPQPASNARRTWYSELVGGAEASQNGLGARTPQNSTLRSTITTFLFSRCKSRRVSGRRGSLTVPVTCRCQIQFFRTKGRGRALTVGGRRLRQGRQNPSRSSAAPLG